MVSPAACLWLLCAGAAFAAQAPEVRPTAASGEEDDSLRRLARTLRGDPEASDRVAERIFRSRIAEDLANSPDPELGLAKIRQWVKKNPEDAAALALGFAKDDAQGTHDFEDSLFRGVNRLFEVNPDFNRGIFGKLKLAGAESQAAMRDDGLDDDERTELLRKFFEGGAPASEKVGSPGSQGGPSGGLGAASAGSGSYDRLSAANVSGYSPQVQAWQSEMNRSLVPGAPRLVETGRLDHATLRHPVYALDHDIRKLESSFRAQRASAQARSLGQEARLRAGDLADEKVQAELDRSAGGKDFLRHAARRRKALAAASKARDIFSARADEAKEASRVTAALVKELSRLRREAARRIAAAAALEEMDLLEGAGPVLSPRLRETIARTPVEEGLRVRYLLRGEGLERARQETLGRLAQGLELLESSGEQEKLDEAGRALGAARIEARGLLRLMEEYSLVPERLSALGPAPSGFKDRIKARLARFLPNARFARAWREQGEERRSLEEAFRRVAASAR
ncbi:MAG: hypothetical protein AAB412_03040 [Elusimicrobiota bacterium]